MQVTSAALIQCNNDICDYNVTAKLIKMVFHLEDSKQQHQATEPLQSHWQSLIY